MSNAVRVVFSKFSCQYSVFVLCNCKLLLLFFFFTERAICKRKCILLSTEPVLFRQPIQTPSPQHSYSDTSPTSSPCSDSASSASDCDSEPDQVSTYSEQPLRKKRQRTTFSPLEVWELERAYRRQPYLLSKDEKHLVQRLGITAKSLKVNIYIYC